MSMPTDPPSRMTEALAVPVPIVHPESPYVNNGEFAPDQSPFGTGSPSMREHDVPPPWYFDFSGVWQRHCSAMIQIAVMSAIFGFLVGTFFCTQLWLVEGRLRFISPPSIDGRDVYKPLSLLTYSDLVLTDENLEKLAKEFADRLPPGQPTRYLKSQMKVDAPRNTEIIEVSMDAPDPDLSVALVNRLMQLHIDYTNELRRTTTLRQSIGLLRSTIEKCDAQIRKWKSTIEEYSSRLKSGTPLEQLDQVELDSTYSQRRRSLLEEVKQEQTRLSELEFALTQKQAEYNRQEEFRRRNVGVPVELETAQLALRGAQISVNLSRATISRKQDECRKLPLEYANLRILDQTVLMKESQTDLHRLTEKMKSFGSLPPAGATADAADEEWTRLRQRLLGADSPEFDILKQATRPPYATSSNRKMLTTVGFALPILVAFLAFAYSDHRRGLSGASKSQIAIVEQTARPMPAGDSPLLRSRFQQWLIESPPVTPKLDNNAEMNIEDTPVERSSPHNSSLKGDRSS